MRYGSRAAERSAGRPGGGLRVAAALLVAGFCGLLMAAGGVSAAEPLSSRDLPIVRSAFAAADQGRWSDAEQLAATATDRLPLKILTWMDYLRPQAGHSFDQLTGFIAQNPGWPLLSVLRLRVEDDAADIPSAQLLPWFAQHPPVTAFGRLRQAELLAEAGRNAEAASLVRATWVDDDFDRADEASLLARYGGLLRKEDDIRRLDRLLWSGRLADAKRMLPRVPLDRRRLAEARIALAEAAKNAQAVLARVPRALAGDPGLAFDRLRWRLRKNMDDAAAEVVEHQADLGRPEAWWSERQLLARRLVEENEPARAYRMAVEPQLQDPQMVTEAEFTAGWIALRFLHDPAKAAPHFARLNAVAKLPLTLARGEYWAGRTEDALGKPAEALVWYEKAAQYETAYYGQLAAARPGVVPPAKPEPEPTATPAEAGAFEQRELVRVVRILSAIGEEDRMKPFLYRIADTAETPADFAAAADFAEAIGRPDLGVAVAKRAAYRGVSLLRAGYPVVWVPRNAGTEQALLLALTRQESAFDLRAVSPSGALGLMQLMPGTARQTANQIALPYAASRLTSDGPYNVTLGQAYFDSLLATFNGSYVLAVAAYNAGPGRVEQWIGEFGDPRQPSVDAVDWVESIPYGETRNYVERVLENLQVYRLRVGDRSLAFTLEADLRR